MLGWIRWRYPTCNDFGSEIIPKAAKEYNVQVCAQDSDWSFSRRLILIHMILKLILQAGLVINRGTVVLSRD